MAARPVSVTASRQARPSSWSAWRSSSPRPTSAATCRLTVDRSACTLAATALARIGPSAATVCSSSWVAESTSSPAASSRALDRRTVRCSSLNESATEATGSRRPPGEPLGAVPVCAWAGDPAAALFAIADHPRNSYDITCIYQVFVYDKCLVRPNIPAKRDASRLSGCGQLAVSVLLCPAVGLAPA